jgi:hypothetical protein
MSICLMNAGTATDEYGWHGNDERCPAGQGGYCPVPTAGPDSPQTWECPDCGDTWTFVHGVATGPVRPWTG